MVENRREQYYWVRYWYWVVLGCFRNIGIAIGIVKGFSKYWYWVLVKGLSKYVLVLVLGIVKSFLKYWYTPVFFVRNFFIRN